MLTKSHPNLDKQAVLALLVKVLWYKALAILRDNGAKDVNIRYSETNDEES
ncbi:MAG TPA: hypothetical protein VKV40_07390 [Ktedonobacteraceae bacterium]|nr:hypothetical protein [Ktedonobacteraceae bacterium]